MATKSQASYKEIPLNEGMYGGNWDNGSLYNYKILHHEQGKLRPSIDWDYYGSASNGFAPKKLVHTRLGVFALGEDDTYDIAIYSVSSNRGKMTFKAGFNVSGNLSDAAPYKNSDGEFIYIMDTDGDVSRYNINTSSVDVDVETSFSGDAYSAGYSPRTIVYNHIDDRLYFLTDEYIHYLDNTTFGVNKFAVQQNVDYKYIFTYKNYIGIAGKITGDTKNIVQFWDRDDSKATLSQSIIVNVESIAAIGVIKNELYLVGTLSIYGNRKEYEAKAVLLKYNGSGFNQEISSMFIFEQQPNTLFNGIEEDYFLVYIDGDEKHNIYKSGLFQFNINGDIRLLGKLSNEFYQDRFYSTVKVYEVLYSVLRFNEGFGYKYTAAVKYDNNSSSFSDFQDPSIYITSFIGDKYLRKQLTEFIVSFEKLHAGEEEGHFYYRTSQYDSWTEIGVGVDHDIDTVNTTPNKLYTKRFKLNDLPEFTQIQFKFETQEGLTVHGAKMFFNILNYE